MYESFSTVFPRLSTGKNNPPNNASNMLTGDKNLLVASSLLKMQHIEAPKEHIKRLNEINKTNTYIKFPPPKFILKISFL